MNLQFEFNNRMKKITLKPINIIVGASQSGKSNLLKYLVSVFEGKTTAFIDNHTITKEQFEVKVIYPTQTIDDELKMTTKTEIMLRTKKLVSEIDKEEIEELFLKIKEVLLPIEEKIKREFSFEEQGFEFKDIISFIKEHYRFVDTSNYSVAMKKYLLLHSLISKLFSEKNLIILIDDFDSYFDLEQMIKITDKLIENKRARIFLFTKSSDLCKLLYDKYPIYLINHGLVEFKEVISEFSSQNINYIKDQLSFTLITDSEIEQNYSNFAKIYFNDLFQLAITNNKEYVLENFKKMKLYSKKDIEILQNFSIFIYEKYRNNLL